MMTIVRKIKEYPLLIMVCVFLTGMFILYQCKPDTSFSDMENRYLTKRPAVTVKGLADGTYMQEFETYTDEQIPFRTPLIQLKAVMERLLLKDENNGIILGSEGYLFEKVLHTDEQLYKNEAILENFIESTNQTVYAAIAPNACELFPELVPDGAPHIDQKKEITAFYDQLSNIENCRVVDLEAALSEHRKEQLYYRTDHHWTTQGAYFAYEEICRQMGSTPVDLSTLSAHQVPDFYGTLYAKYKGFGVEPDTITYYDIPIVSLVSSVGTKDSLYDMDKTKIYDKYAMFLYGNDGVCTIQAENAGNGKELVVFKDSYANCLIPFLTYQYDTITIVDLRYFGDSVKELLQKSKSADILLLYNFSHLNEDKHFYRLTS